MPSPDVALKCPAGSHYNPCGSACAQPSCQDPAGPGGPCDQPCVEGCVCNPGLILSGDKCVPLSQCGCTDESGKYRPVGGTWFTEADCSERCKCNANHKVTCEPWRCSPAQECKVLEGVLDCHSTGKPSFPPTKVPVPFYVIEVEICPTRICPNFAPTKIIRFENKVAIPTKTFAAL